MAGWLKRLRQKLRNRRPALLLASAGVVICVGAGLAWSLSTEDQTMESSEEAKATLAPQNWDVILKENAVFGIDQNGMLTLYKGNPEDNRVIQTFFQIDLERMESSLPYQDLIKLQQGIPFSTVAEYNSILSTYGEFAIESKLE